MASLALFDIAGTTLYDPDGVGRCLKAALSEAGIPWTHEQVTGLMGIPKPLVIKAILDDAQAEGSVDHIHQRFRSKMIDYYANDPEVREIDGARQAFDLLRSAGVKVALDTGFDRPIVEAILDRLKWRDAIDLSVASDEVAHGRPHPDLALRAMQLAGIEDPGRVAKIGDTPSDLGEGTNARCGLVIGVTYGTHSRKQLAVHPHTHLADSIEEVTWLILTPRE